MKEKKPCTIKYITKEQYEEIITKGSTVIDGETVLYEDNLSDKDSNDMFDETVIDTLKEMAVKHSNDSYVYRVLVNAINLIHRLQDDNKRLTEHVEKCLDEIDRLKTANAKQQAEIERLTEYNANLNGMCLEFIDKNAELQKQVDELSEPICGKFKDNSALLKAYKSLEKDYTKKAQKLRKLQDELKDICLDCPYKLKFDEIEKQAVKDTAKEIYCEINSCIEQGQEYCGLDWRGLLTAKYVILVYCKKKGVEVE